MKFELKNNKFTEVEIYEAYLKDSKEYFGGNIRINELSAINFIKLLRKKK